MKNYLLLLLAIMIGCNSIILEEENKMIVLNQNWKFKQADKNEWYNATIPGCVHTDLLENELIKEPYYRLNEHDLQWIDKKDWEYKTIFNVEKDILNKNRIVMIFEGLDTYAEISLNGNKLLSADNMFRTWEIDVKPFLKSRGNELHIRFNSPINIGLDKLSKEKYKYPDPPNDLSEIGKIGDKKVSIFTRKAGYHFGWDWGPRLVTSGIWRPIKIRGWNDIELKNVFFQQEVIFEDKATFTGILEIESEIKNKAEIKILSDGKLLKKQSLQIKPGINQLKVPFEIQDPELWWPNGLGNQRLYDLTAEVIVNGELQQSISHKIGIRTIRVVTEPDSIGTSFYFEVNGHPVFMKGANYIPQDVFINDVTEEHYDYILQSAADANMNMIRVWGGGIYENDIFYQKCDEKGLLVWQDFMFACSMYPGDKAFLENVRHEAIDNVKRLRNHPSIAMWCGNNECLGAWFHWGWEQRVLENQGQEAADYIFSAYEKKYHDILPKVVKRYDNRFYWSSSPCSGMGELPVNHAGDIHYWGVWHGKEPFSKFEEVIPRFMSEYGFQSFPEFSTVDKYTEPEDYHIHSEVMKSHQRSGIGNKTIEQYMLRDYKAPKDFESFLYASQVLQAEGIGFGIEAHRRNRHRCMGTLYWQLNDCWPVASWSSIDYYGKWKALHYYTKKLYQPILVSPHLENDKVEIHVVSDLLDTQKATMELKLLDFFGITYWSQIRDIEIAANQSKIYYEINKQDLLETQSSKDMVLQAIVKDGDKILSENVLYFEKPKDLNLPQTPINCKIDKQSDKYLLTLSTEKLAKNLMISVDNCEGFLSDNYFDLIPKQKVIVEFMPDEKVSELELSFKMINDL